MTSFARILSEVEIQDVSTFVETEFVIGKKSNTSYHTVENGWAGHQKRYAEAYPFVLGEIAIDTPPDQLRDGQANGLNLFYKTCITCHDGKAVRDRETIWDKYPLSQQGCGVVCHEGKPDFPWDRAQRPSAGVGPATPYEAHAIAPVLENPTPLQTRGESLYQKNCAFCHAMDGTGGNWIGSFLEPHARNLTDRSKTAHLDDDTLIKTINEGLPRTSMPAWRNVLDDHQIAAIAAYVKRAFFVDRPAISASKRP